MGNTDVRFVTAKQLYESLPGPLKTRWDKTPDRYWRIPEVGLRAELWDQTNRTLRLMSMFTKLRLSFWEERCRAMDTGEAIRFEVIPRSIMRVDEFEDIFGQFPALFPWMLTPVSAQNFHQKEIGLLSEERMVDLLSISAVDEKTGKVDARLAMVQVKLYELIQNRLYGSITQKIESNQKSVNVNVNTDSKSEDGKTVVANMTSIDEIEQRLAQIREKRAAMRNVSPIQVDQQKLMRPDKIGE